MTRVAKYRPGNVLTVEQAIGHIRAERHVFYEKECNGPGWMKRWSVGDLIIDCQMNLIRDAIITDEWLAQQKKP